MTNRATVDGLKSEGRTFEAGALAHAEGRDRAYGVHIGMRSTLDMDRYNFYLGWDAAEVKARTPA